MFNWLKPLLLGVLLFGGLLLSPPLTTWAAKTSTTTLELIDDQHPPEIKGYKRGQPHEFVTGPLFTGEDADDSLKAGQTSPPGSQFLPQTNESRQLLLMMGGVLIGLTGLLLFLLARHRKE